MKRIVRAFFMALGMFTAIPCPFRPWNEEDRGLMLATLPLVGAVLGGLWYALSLLARRWLPATAPEIVAVLPWLLTGLIHLDGFMDTSDALLSWRPLEDRLRILKDAHAGAFAIIAMILLALFSFGASRHLAGGDLRVLLFIPVVSRCGSAYCVLSLRPLGHSQYAQTRGSAALRLAVIAAWLAAVVLCAAWLSARAIALIVETLAYALAMLWAHRTLKGVSGDTAGFALSVAECAALIALANQIAIESGGAR